MNKLRKPQSDFTIIPNALIRCSALSLKAKGLYGLLFSKPDGWTYVEEVLVKESADGRESFRSGIKELVEAGWLTKVQVRDEKGNFTHADWHLSVAGSSVDGKPVAGESPASNTDISKTEETKTIPQPPKGAEEVDGFDQFWSAYPRKVGKPNALKAWKRHKPDLPIVLDAIRRWKTSDQWTKNDGTYIPYPASWLNSESWNDAVPGEKVAPSADEMKAAEERIAAKRRENEERERRMVEDRRRQLGLVT